MSYDFEMNNVSMEYFRQSQTEFMYKKLIPMLAGAVVKRRTISPNFKVIRMRSALGKWLKSRPYKLSVRRIVDAEGKTLRYSIWLELDDIDDAMYFKLTWGGR